MHAIRPVRLPADIERIRALDRSFITDRVYRVVRTPWTFTLEETPIDPPLHKTFPLDDDLGDDQAWTHGLVVEDGTCILGFAAFAHERWNRRTTLWHLYIRPAARGQGVGRALVEEVSAAAQQAGTRAVWLETSNLNYPAIGFYRRLGFELCGLDTSLYDPAGPAGGETALYFALSVPNL